MRNIFTRLQNSNEVNESFVESIVTMNLPIAGDVFDQHLSTGSNLTFFSFASIKQFLDNNYSHKESIPASLALLHHNSVHGSIPEDVCRLFQEEVSGLLT